MNVSWIFHEIVNKKTGSKSSARWFNRYGMSNFKAMDLLTNHIARDLSQLFSYVKVSNRYKFFEMIMQELGTA